MANSSPKIKIYSYSYVSALFLSMYLLLPICFLKFSHLSSEELHLKGKQASDMKHSYIPETWDEQPLIHATFHLQ